MGKIAKLCILLLFIFSITGLEQAPGQAPAKGQRGGAGGGQQVGADSQVEPEQLDGRPYNPETEPDIDMFMGSYKESNNRGLFRAMIERDILTPLAGSDPLHPTRRGACLTNIKLLSFVQLPSGQRVVEARIDPSLKEQRMFYCSCGKGTLESNSKTYDLYPGVGIVVPPNVAFSMHCTSMDDLSFFCITEKIPDTFTPKTEIVWADEASARFSSNDVHWTHNYKTLFRKGDLATFTCGPVWFTPMTMGQPHSHGGPSGTVEEIWFSLTDGVTCLLGKELRPFDFGTAYKVPSDNQTPHSNINVTDKTIKVFWFMN